MPTEHFDVLIVGAGLSGIGAAYHLQKDCPQKSYAILEGRDAIGGTWDLFRYPGIRSDSDMYTMGYSFRPWTSPKALADGTSIREYICATAREAGIDRRIRFNTWVKRASWSSPDARWTVEVTRPAATPGAAAETIRYTCSFLFMCSGYYRYSEGYTPEFVGAARFQGRIIHPQKWPADLDYAGKRVVVIGSGATAVTLVPAMATTAAHVTMLQRSPTYVVSLPGEDAVANWLRRHVPEKLAYGLTRWKNVLLGMFFYQLSQRQPTRMKNFILKEVRAHLGPDYDVATHFTPRYNPWDQRLCLVPDADLFQAIKGGRASVVTDEIAEFTAGGIKLKSGKELAADIIVTATGLTLELLGGIAVEVDGRAVDFSRTLAYKGMMYSDVPNLASCFGYTNASWTLRADLTCQYVCRLLNYLDSQGFAAATPRNRDPAMPAQPLLSFSSGYIQRTIAKFPKQGTRAPWRAYQNYLLDLISLRLFGLQDEELELSRRPPPAGRPAAAASH
ncbi:MAG TPA: NAD(P)/FAD-dependent oxidoreductase [Pseudomonadota bacterium]|nr:NAD(P)/FAD-dependent oxidoreductase [Pseudomonadota bacterium]